MGERFDQWSLRYAGWVIRHRWWVIAISLGLAVLAASGARHLSFSNNYRVFFSQENPELNAFESFQNTYTKNDNILFVLQPADGVVFTPRLAEAVEWLTAEAWKVPFAIRVDSVTNFQYSWADGDDLTVEDLVRDGASLSPELLAARQAAALAEPLLRDNLISPDADTTGVNVTIQYPELDEMGEVPAAVAHARGLAAELRARYPELTVVLSGLSMLNNAFAESGQADAQTLVPLMYLLLIIVMALALRSMAGTVTTLLVIGLSTATAMGLAGHFGIKLTPISITAPTIILTLAIADSVHLLVSMLGLMRAGQEKLQALKESVRINFVPVSITSLTTIVGFLSLNFSDAPPFWHLGNITAMGIAAAWAFSLAFLPALLSVLPVRPGRRGSVLARLEGLMERLAEFVIVRRRPILVMMGTLALGLAALAPTVSLNDQFVRYFDKRVEFRNHADFAVQNLNGVYVIEFSVPAAESGGVSEPAYLERLGAFSSWLRAQPEVMHVYSYSDVIKRLNKNMHGDDENWYRVPENRELAAQYLLLYEISLPFGLDLNDRINVDKSATRVSVTVDDLSTTEIRAFLDRSINWFADNAPAYMHNRPTGASVMFSYISQRNIESMLRGNLIAILAIALIMILSLRSLGLGLLSLVPNAVPILMTFGVWSLLVGQVGMAAATVTATSLGIVVDDTVHFLSKYLLARRERGHDRADAIRYAFRTVGPAIVVTTVVLTAGFSVLAASTFLVNAQMGMLTAIAVVLALVTDFLLLPALLLIGYTTQTKEVSHELETAQQVA
jgi:predicted RND superfamily exporter protein